MQKSWLSLQFDRLVKPSTRAFFRLGRRTPGYTLFDWLHGYVYGRWPYLYIGIGTGEHPLARRFGPWVARISRLFPRRPPWMQDPPIPATGGVLHTGTIADTYHGKVVPLPAARALITIHEPIAQPQPEAVIPFASARDLIIEHPDHILALDCPCRVSRPHPCLPLDVCLIVGEPFVSFVEQHHPQRCRRITQDEAVAILSAEDGRGHVHHAFFKDAMLGRFYAICNCCACCCGAMQAQRYGTPMLISSGYLCVVDEHLCIGCGDCQDACQFQALSLVDSCNTVDVEKCMGCGVCVSKCPQEALSLRLAPEKGQPLYPGPPRTG